MKSHFLERLLAGILAVVLLVPMLSSCDGMGTKQTESTDTVQTPETENEKILIATPGGKEIWAEPGEIDLFGDNMWGYGIGIPEKIEGNSLLLGSTWPDVVSNDLISYCGFLDKQRECPADTVREIVTTTLSDGSQGKALRIANDASVSYAGAGNIITGFHGLMPNETYTLYAMIRYTSAPEDLVSGYLRDVYISCNQDITHEKVCIQPDTGWQLYEFQFETGDTLEERTKFCIGADDASPFLHAGFEILIERICLIGREPEEDTRTMNPTLKTIDTTVDYSGYGLQIDENGVILLNGEPFYGMGVNFHGPVYMRMEDDECDLEIYFQRMQEANIPYCRIMFGVFYDYEVKTYVSEQTHDKMIAALDYVVATAEKYNIGIIASLFWNNTAFIGHFGENPDALADPNSQGVQLQLKYIDEVVNRYKYSPALWVWEIGNEGNLRCEIQNEDSMYVGDDGKKKVFSTKTLTAYYEILGKAIREADPYRMITGGDSAPRDSSMALYNSNGSSWYPKNTYEDYITALQWYTPAPLDTVSLHYPDPEWISEYVRMAKELKLGLFVGEFHADGDLLFPNPLDALSAEESPEEAAEQASWLAIRDAYVENGIQLATAWCFGRYAVQDFDTTSIEYNMVEGIYQNVYQYEALRETNTMYLEKGMNKAAAYWEKAIPALCD